MTYRLFLSALVLGAGALAQAVAATVGAPAPDFELRDVNGKTVRLGDYRGHHVVLEWTNPGCPFVIKHYRSGNMQALQKEASDRKVVWLTVNSTEPMHRDYMSPARLGRWTEEQGAVPTATLMDEEGRVGLAYAARVTPHMYIVDPQGTLIYAGGIDSVPSAREEDIKTASNHVRAGLAQALAGRPISRPVTRAYGCSIKYR
ncbi:MAG: redoxin domain-containing protein [Curvibacter sp.]|jgi:hypothetical protein|nr:redoxin domain-containing protein [Curvibacter sp.]